MNASRVNSILTSGLTHRQHCMKANPLSLTFGLKIISINFPIHQSTSPVSARNLPIPPCLSSPRENISHPRKTDIIMFIFPSHIYTYKDTVTSLKLPISVVVYISTIHVERDCVRSAILNKMLEDKIVPSAWPSQGLQCKCNVYIYLTTRPHISTLSLLAARCLSNSRVIPV